MSVEILQLRRVELVEMARPQVSGPEHPSEHGTNRHRPLVVDPGEVTPVVIRMDDRVLGIVGRVHHHKGIEQRRSSAPSRQS